MDPITLQPEVVALIQHVELQKAGWWEKTLERLILGAVYLEGNDLSFHQISEVLRKTFHAPIAQEILEKTIQLLVDQDDLLLHNGGFRLPQCILEKLEQDIGTAEKVMRDAESRFDAALQQHGPEIADELDWKTFEAEFLRPLLAQTSANTYNLASGTATIGDDFVVCAFLNRFAGPKADQARLVIAAFLNQKDEVIRHYVGMLLHAHFCIASSGLKKDVLSRIEYLNTKSPKFNLFVDTNFLFSLLELHENPSNETAKEFRELVKVVGDILQIKFYITTRTVKEAQASILAAKNSVWGISPSSRVSNAAREVGLSESV